MKPRLQFRSLSTNHTIPNTSRADADTSTGGNARATGHARGYQREDCDGDEFRRRRAGQHEARPVTGGLQEQVEVEAVEPAQHDRYQSSRTSSRQQENLHRQVRHGQRRGGFHEPRCRLPAGIGHRQHRYQLSHQEHGGQGQ